jgi:ferrochelatase
MEHIRNISLFPKMTFVPSYASHPALIHAFCEKGQQCQPEKYDHILFSFHGLPESQIKKIDHKEFCYQSQCYGTAHEIASKLGIGEENYTICFQSRLGEDPWIQPYTVDVVKQVAKNGKKRMLVFCPSFVCDCLETTYEIGIEYAHEFRKAGGEHLHLVEGLNSSPAWIEALQQIILEHSSL